MALRTASGNLAAPVQVNAAGAVTLTPTSTASQFARLSSDAAGNSIIADTAAFTPAAAPKTYSTFDAVGVTPVAGWALRKMRSAYTGPAIRVRNAGNAEADIGFAANGTLDRAMLLAHTGITSSSHGFVTKVYNQWGAGGYIVQTNQSKQPRIVFEGVLRELNGER